MELAESLQVTPSADRRAALRAEIFARHPGWYSPWVHLAIPGLFALSAMAAAVWLLENLEAWQVGFGLGLLVLSNAAEWRMHKSWLHQRRRGASLLYDRHTPEHHMVFVTEDMAIRSRREFQLVLMPPWAIVALGLGLAPGIAAFWYGVPFQLFAPAAQHNLACVFTFVTMGYVVSYEWLHLSYHLPPDSFVGRRALVRFMRRHHALHHDPTVMQKWNFNVSLPLWDLVRRTYWRPAEDRPGAAATREQPGQPV